MPQKRNRPYISTSVSPNTLAMLTKVAKGHGLERIGPTVDYIVHDWVGLKRAALEEACMKEAIHKSSIEIQYRTALFRVLGICHRARTSRPGSPEARYLEALRQIEEIVSDALDDDETEPGRQRVPQEL